MFRLLKSTLLFAIVFSATPALAQGIPGVSEPVILIVSPQYPAPNSTVTISAQSYSTDLNRAVLTWYSGGKVIEKGTGLTSVSMPSGAAGATTRVSVDVATPDLGTISVETSWHPADITLVWETDGYIPPFYRGKALEMYGSRFKVTALPEFFNAAGARVDPKTLVYSWQKNGDNMPDDSGYGKQSFTSNQSSFVRGGDEISVEVSNADRSIVSTKSITLSPTTPDIIFYESSPLYGIRYDAALPATFVLPAEELTLFAAPYGMSGGSLISGAMTFDWVMNGAPLTTFQNKPAATLRSSGTAGGQSEVSLQIQHKTRMLQGGQAAITILQ